MYTQSSNSFKSISLHWCGSTWDSSRSLSPEELVLKNELDPSVENCERAAPSGQGLLTPSRSGVLPQWQGLAWRCPQAVEGAKPALPSLCQAPGNLQLIGCVFSLPAGGNQASHLLKGQFTAKARNVRRW